MLSQKGERYKGLPLLFNGHGASNLSDEGIAIIRDMVNESTTWNKLYKIDIDSLGYPYQSAIKQMRAFIKVVGNAPYDAKLFSLKYRIFCDLSKTTYQKISKLIDSIGDTLTNDLKFEKNNDKQFNDNTVLKFNGETLVDGNTAFQAVLFSYLNSKFTTNKEKASCEFIQLKIEFKSIRQGSQLTKAKIEAACNNLDSLADKLMLLELCYKKIIKANYYRRHTLIDSYFSFMKNPLTMSQRKHIGLLKAKMDELINEHQLKMTNELTKEQFKWVLKNYFKLVRHKDRRVNFNSISDVQVNNLHASQGIRN